MAPWLGTCTDLAEGQSSIPSTHIGSSQLPLTLVPGDLLPISGLHRHCICMLACTHLQTHNLKIKVFKGEGGRGERKPRHGGVSSLFLLSLVCELLRPEIKETEREPCGCAVWGSISTC